MHCIPVDLCRGDSGLSRVDLALLAYIIENPNKQGARADIAAACGCAPNSIPRSAKKLEALGLIVRVPGRGTERTHYSLGRNMQVTERAPSRNLDVSRNPEVSTCGYDHTGSASEAETTTTGMVVTADDGGRNLEAAATGAEPKPRACIGYAGARAETPINITTTLRDNLSNLELVVEGGSGGKDFALTAEPASRAKPKRSATERSMPKKPTLKMIEHAASKGFVNGSVSAMFERWRDYHIAKATPIADHEASWRTWVGNQAEFSKAKPKNRNGVRPNPYLHTRVVR